MAADIRTAALALLNELGGLPDELEQQHIDAARAVIRVVTPTREQIEDVLRKSGAWCGDCNFEMDHCSGCKHVREVYAESVLRLIQELAEGEMIET